MYKSCEPHRPAIENISTTEMLYWEHIFNRNVKLRDASLTEVLYWEMSLLKKYYIENISLILSIISLTEVLYVETYVSYLSYRSIILRILFILEIICFIEISNREISSIWGVELAGLASCYTRNTIPRLSLVQTKLFLLRTTGKTELADLIWD